MQFGNIIVCFCIAFVAGSQAVAVGIVDQNLQLLRREEKPQQPEVGAAHKKAVEDAVAEAIAEAAATSASKPSAGDEGSPTVDDEANPKYEATSKSDASPNSLPCDKASATTSEALTPKILNDLESKIEGKILKDLAGSDSKKILNHGTNDMSVPCQSPPCSPEMPEEPPAEGVTCSSKLRFSCQGKTSLPKDAIAYPATQKLLDAAKETTATSVRVFNKGQLNGTTWSDLSSWIAPLKPPTHPTDPGFWEEFDLITTLQKNRRAKETAASKMALPTMFAKFSMEEGAAAVEKDFPSKFPTALVEQWLGSGGVKFDKTVVPQGTQDDFVNSIVMLSRVIGWAVSTVSPFAFGAKWYNGRARPEEVACAILKNDSSVSSVPPKVKAAVEALGVTKPGCVDYTAYSNGSPRHPAWPAMHSAASSASVYLATVLNLSPEQLKEAQNLDCAVATFRSFAGVHYESDNMAGLSIGQEVLRRELPKMLHRNYGSDIAAVQSKMEKVIAANDWRKVSCIPKLVPKSR